MKYIFFACLVIACYCPSCAQNTGMMPQKIVLYANDIETETPFDVTPNLFCKQISMQLVDSVVIQDSVVMHSIIDGLNMSSSHSQSKSMDVRGMILFKYDETKDISFFYSRFSVQKGDTLYSISPILPYYLDSIRSANNN